jgi:hypothetical protein
MQKFANHHSIKINSGAIKRQLAMGSKRAAVQTLICQSVCGIMQSRNLWLPSGITTIKVNRGAIFDTFRSERCNAAMRQIDCLFLRTDTIHYSHTDRPSI